MIFDLYPSSLLMDRSTDKNGQLENEQDPNEAMKSPANKHTNDRNQDGKPILWIH
ncbi:hypothetical protein ABRT01_05020 [Lentibacillus sp. L22]|uniref:hypothetical protein n=1 Tax=Lentibacillus sp. L22 TaxID=3163028 RepID=UPI0034673BE4